MTRYAALLRGVNVGGRNRVSMAELRACLTGLGYLDVVTHLQSGNAVFTAAEGQPERVAAAVEGQLEDALGRRVAVTVRTAEELRTVVEGNPLAVSDPARFLVVFLSEPVSPGWLGEVDPAAFAPERMRATGREVYLDLPDGIHRAKLPKLVERRAPGTCTARNWNTVTRLAELAAAHTPGPASLSG